MQPRAIGRSDRKINPIGLGCMGMSVAYGPAMEEADAIRLIHEAIDLGVDHFDTAELYGGNEALMGACLAGGKRERVFLATKFGPVLDPVTGIPTGAVDGGPENARRALEQSLRRLRTDHIDLWYLHRPDKNRGVEDTVGAMARAVKEGKVGAIGLSEASSENIRRGHAVYPISAVQTEYSIFSRDVEANVLPTLQQIGATLVAYSPLGRGMLTGAAARPDETDWRTHNAPRFTGAAFDANMALVAEIGAIGERAGAQPAQVALAWVLARAPNVVTIPGTTKLANLRTNLGAGEITLTPAEMERLNAMAARVQGARYNEMGLARIDTD